MDSLRVLVLIPLDPIIIKDKHSPNAAEQGTEMSYCYKAVNWDVAVSLTYRSRSLSLSGSSKLFTYFFQVPWLNLSWLHYDVWILLFCDSSIVVHKKNRCRDGYDINRKSISLKVVCYLKSTKLNFPQTGITCETFSCISIDWILLSVDDRWQTGAFYSLSASWFGSSAGLSKYFCY